MAAYSAATQAVDCSQRGDVRLQTLRTACQKTAQPLQSRSCKRCEVPVSRRCAHAAGHALLLTISLLTQASPTFTLLTTASFLTELIFAAIRAQQAINVAIIISIIITLFAVKLAAHVRRRVVIIFAAPGAPPALAAAAAAAGCSALALVLAAARPAHRPTRLQVGAAGGCSSCCATVAARDVTQLRQQTGKHRLIRCT